MFILPRIEDILDTLGKSQYFTTVDLASGFRQIEMDPATHEKSAFTTYCGLREFVRMPFGMCTTFQRLMQVVLADIEWKFCFVYLDDILKVLRRSMSQGRTYVEAKEVLLCMRYGPLSWLCPDKTCKV